MVSLYRNVDESEFYDIASTGKFGTGGGMMEGKWFALEGEHARIPKPLVDQLCSEQKKLDGIGPAVYADSRQLD
jgi:hypothetical protein